MSPLPTLGHIIDKDSSFLISSPFDITKKLSWRVIDWQLSIPNVNGHAYSYPLPPQWWWRLNLDLNGIEGVIHLSVPENYSFESIISDYFTGSLLPPPTIMDPRGAHKRHHGYIYSYRRVQNSYHLFKKNHDSTQMLSSINLHVTPSYPGRYRC